jgi:TP53 regulating kinase-like protein
VVIDFGLSFQSRLLEDRAVDLYVLERALLSTHPHSAKLFARILQSYAAHCALGAKVLRRLDDVRARGRKRDMVG